MKKEKITKGFKGFNKDLTCNGFQYKEGETFEMQGDIKRCEKGFHFCTEPLDILRYYNPADSVFHYVEGFGEGSTDNEDSKIAVSKIKIGAKISIAEFVKLSFKAILKRCKNNVKSNSGYRSMAIVSGKNSLAVNHGIQGKAMASLNSWITLAEWVYENEWVLKCVKSAKIDGKKLKPDTLYQLIDGKFIKV